MNTSVFPMFGCGCFNTRVGVFEPNDASSSNFAKLVFTSQRNYEAASNTSQLTEYLADSMPTTADRFSGARTCSGLQPRSSNQIACLARTSN